MKFIKIVVLILIVLRFLCSDIALCNEESLFLLRPQLQFDEKDMLKNEELSKMQKDSEIIISSRVAGQLMSILGYLSLVKGQFKDSEKIQRLCSEISNNILEISYYNSSESYVKEYRDIQAFFDAIEEKVLDKSKLVVDESEALFIEEKTGQWKDRTKSITFDFSKEISGIRNNIRRWRLETDSSNINDVLRLYLNTLASSELKNNIVFSVKKGQEGLAFEKDIKYEALILMGIIDNLLMHATKIQGTLPYDKNIEIKTSLYSKKWIRIEIVEHKVFSQEFYDALQNENWLEALPEDASKRYFFMMFKYLKLKGGRIKIEAETEKNQQILFEARFDAKFSEIKQDTPKSQKFSGTQFTIDIPVEENILGIGQKTIRSVG